MSQRISATIMDGCCILFWKRTFFYFAQPLSVKCAIAAGIFIGGIVIDAFGIGLLGALAIGMGFAVL